MSSRITYCKDIYYFQVFLLVPAKGLMYQNMTRRKFQDFIYNLFYGQLKCLHC